MSDETQQRLEALADQWDQRADQARKDGYTLSIGYGGGLNDCAMQLRAALATLDRNEDGGA